MNARMKFFVALAMIVLGVAVFQKLSTDFKNFKAEDAALGVDTVAINDHWNDYSLTPSFFDTVTKETSNKKLALILGASQLHSINEYVQGQHLAVTYANQSSQSRNSSVRYMQLTQPNGSFHDLLGLYLCYKKPGVKQPKLLIVALVYDDLIEDLKDTVAECLPSANPKLQKVAGKGYEQLYELRKAYEKKIKDEKTAKQAEVAALDYSLSAQDKLERGISNFLEKNWEAYRYRGNLYSKVVYELYSFALYYISGLSKRRGPTAPENLKQWNLEALYSLIRIAKADGSKVLIYRQPHRPGEVPFYHDRAEYDRFYSELEAYAALEGVLITDFETIVSQDLWGMNGWNFPDVFHFKNRGHEILGKALDGFVEKQEKTHAL